MTNDQHTATILITGATDGIGRALAHSYAQRTLRERPVRLVLIGRRALDELDDPLCTPETYCQADLADSHCAETVADWLDARGIHTLDLLIHNAGVGFVGPVTRQQPADIQRLIAVNLVAPIALTHRLLPRMNRAQGQLVFISSVAAALPAPDYAVYAATKAALDGFVRNLHIELAANPETSGITAQIVRPGATRTGMHAKSGVTRQQMDWEKFPPADAVAAQIVRSIERRSRNATIGATNRLLHWTGRHLSEPFDWIMRWNARRKAAAQPASRAPHTTAQPCCVITGAADGIGRALAAQFASIGYPVIGIDVDAARAAQTEADIRAAGYSISFLIGDLGIETDRARIQRQLVAGPPISVLVHNAGINAVGPFAASDMDRQRQVLAVNLSAPLLMTAELLRRDKLSAGSSLVFLSSLSHFVGYPGAAVYAASKDGLASYARSLSVALAPHNMDVLTVFPGPARTAHARRYSPDNSREEGRMDPAELAERIFQAMRERRRQLVPGWPNRTVAAAGRLAPGLTEQAMHRAILDKIDERRTTNDE